MVNKYYKKSKEAWEKNRNFSQEENKKWSEKALDRYKSLSEEKNEKNKNNL